MAKQIFTRHIQYNYLPKHPARTSTDLLAVGFEPPADASSEYGNLYLCFESLPDDRRINTDNLLQGCGKAFYESGLETEFEKRFRLCLRALNELIIEAKTTCNIGLIATQGSKLLFSDAGTISMLHVRKNKVTKLNGENKASTFKEIGTGKLSAGDKIILCSKAVSTNLTTKEINNLLSDYPLDDLNGVLQTRLDLPKNISFGYVIIATDTVPIAINPNLASEKTDTPSDSKEPSKISTILSKLGKTIKHKGKRAGQKVQKSASSASGKIVPDVSSKTKQGWTSIWAKYINPNPKQAIIVVVSTILIIILIFVGINAVFNNSPGKVKKFDDAIVLIENAQTSKSKNNPSAAKDSIEKAKKLLAEINQTQQDQLNSLANQNKIKYSFSEAQQKVQEIEDSLTSTVRISTSNSFSIPQAKLSSLVWTNGSLYGVNPIDGSIIEINPLLGNPVARGSNPDLLNSVSAQPLNGGGLVAIGKTAIWQYTPVTGLQQLKAASLPQAVDVASYLSNIYLLSPTENQVIRYTKSGTNLNARNSILKNLSAGELASATSMAISGNIFVADGKEIRLFESGSERNFKLSNLPDNFGDIGKIFQNTEKGYFLLLNTAGTRLALLNAESDSASFVRQYAMNGDAVIQAFTVEPTSSQLMLFSDGKIVSNRIEK